MNQVYNSSSTTGLSALHFFYIMIKSQNKVVYMSTLPPCKKVLRLKVLSSVNG